MTTPPDRSNLAPASGSGRFVGFFIVLTFAIFFIAVSLLAYHWLTTSEPTSVLIIEASPDLAGAQIQVKGIDFPIEHNSIIGKGGRYTLPFYLDAGTYTVRITKDGKKLVDREITLAPRRGLRLNFTEVEPNVPTTRTASP